MSIDEAYDYINNSDNEFPSVFRGLHGLDRSEALRILAVLRWLQDNPRAQVMTANTNQPSGQTVREILEGSQFTDWQWDGEDELPMDAFDMDKAEAAINAHIVSVLEELKADIERMQPDPDYYAQAIDAAIKRYKEKA